jgi:hypothetical protein
LLAALTACSTPFSRQFEKIADDWDKSQVVETLGSPTLARRWQGQDHWIYVFYEDQQRWVREVHFEDGEIVALSRTSLSYRRWRALERSESLEDLQRQLVR